MTGKMKTNGVNVTRHGSPESNETKKTGPFGGTSSKGGFGSKAPAKAKAIPKTGVKSPGV